MNWTCPICRKQNDKLAPCTECGQRPGAELWVNGDIERMANSLIDQVRRIGDEVPMANQRRAKLLRAAAYLNLAFAELTELSELGAL